MSAQTRLAHIKALGFTIDQEMIDRENRIDEAAQLRIRDEMIASVGPMIMTLRSAVAGTYVVDDEQAADSEWLNSDPRTPKQRDLDEWQAEASDVGYGKNGRPR